MQSRLCALPLSNRWRLDMLREKSSKANNGSSNAGKSTGGAKQVPIRKKSTGIWNPDWEPFAKLDPAWTEKVMAMAIAPAVAGALDAKTIELIGIALDASCTNMYAPGVRRHIQRAIKAGARDHRGTAADESAGLAQHVPRRTDPARRDRGSREARGLIFTRPECELMAFSSDVPRRKVNVT